VARSRVLILASPVLLLLCTTAAPQQAPVRGHVKVQEQYLSAASNSLADAIGYGDSDATSLDLRISGSWSKGRFRFDADYLLQAVRGSAVEFQNQLEALEPDLFIDRTETQWLPLDDTLADDDRSRAVQSLDRFSMSYAAERWVLKLGRQAYSWANGIVFRPLDIFDPFAPDVLDDSYKPGIDAMYAQRLFADGSDLVALIVPRRDPVTGQLSRSQSSVAVKWHQFGERLQTDWLVARDYRDKIAGLGISGSLGQAVWRASIVPVWLDNGGTRTSLVVNFEHAWQWRSRNVSGFVEYFRNGFGRTGREYALDALEPELVERLSRGQVFDTGRDYVVGGLRIELTPLLEIDNVLLFNANDRSALALVRGSYSVAQNISLDFGLRAGIGPSRTEFGGLPTTAGSDTVDAPPDRVYARIAYYF
jgi:hypothetical protein